MINQILRAIDALAVLSAPRGRHRAGHMPLAPVHRREPRPALRRALGPYATAPLDGSATPPVRPYVLTSEQRARRRALWPARYDIGVGPRRIHGVEVGG
ncbi:hypothetical protein ACFXC8_27580 [Streptomyces sp. NPDC059441]|uniref:hypothetical protein n=1 Tax=unclassified Streptomyces TaxID=2593676 RepID=UPI002258562B|nr:hypothetical protein [Streptomyces sp. NBC_01764]MCX4407579.1 hypothetical protein [Streptomyces sp. NBC_01764]